MIMVKQGFHGILSIPDHRDLDTGNPSVGLSEILALPWMSSWLFSSRGTAVRRNSDGALLHPKPQGCRRSGDQFGGHLIIGGDWTVSQGLLEAWANCLASHGFRNTHDDTKGAIDAYGIEQHPQAYSSIQGLLLPAHSEVELDGPGRHSVDLANDGRSESDSASVDPIPDNFARGTAMRHAGHHDDLFRRHVEKAGAQPQKKDESEYRNGAKDGDDQFHIRYFQIESGSQTPTLRPSYSVLHCW